MVALIWFVVINNSESDKGYVDTGVHNDDILSIYDGSGKPFVLVLSYKNCISCIRHCNSVCKKRF